MNIDALIASSLYAAKETRISSETGNIAEIYRHLIDEAIYKALQKRGQLPSSIIFVYHCPLPEGATKINYRDIAIDQNRSDYEAMIGFHAQMSIATNPDCLWLLITDVNFQPSVTECESLIGSGFIAIARLPLNPLELMFDRVRTMYAYSKGLGSAFNTSFLDGDAFPVSDFSSLWRSIFAIMPTKRRDPGLMPINEGVLHVRSGRPLTNFMHQYLATYEAAETDINIKTYYQNNIRRWRGGQLSLNILVTASLQGMVSFVPRDWIKILPCHHFNFTPKNSEPFDIATKSVLHLKGNTKSLLGEIKNIVNSKGPA